MDQGYLLVPFWLTETFRAYVYSVESLVYRGWLLCCEVYPSMLM